MKKTDEELFNDFILSNLNHKLGNPVEHTFIMGLEIGRRENKEQLDKAIKVIRFVASHGIYPTKYHQQFKPMIVSAREFLKTLEEK